MDIDYLLNPFISKEDLIIRWKSYLESIGKVGNHKEMESLAKSMTKDHGVPSTAISSLFNSRQYVKCGDTISKWTSDFKPIDFKGLDQFECRNVFLISEITKRLSNPSCNDDIKFLGPNNADVLSKGHWCHEHMEDHRPNNVNHAMLKCECLVDETPDEFFECRGCRDKVYPGNKEFIRVPIVEGDKGGWGDFYCSEECLRTFIKLGVMQDMIVTLILKP